MPIAQFDTKKGYVSDVSTKYLLQIWNGAQKIYIHMIKKQDMYNIFF